MSRLYVCPRGTTRLPPDGFQEIWYSSILPKSVEKKIQVSLKYDKNNGYFTWRPIYFISRSILIKMRNVSGRSCRESQNTHFISNAFFFPKIVSFLRSWGKILHSWTYYRWQYGACASHAGYLTLHTHTNTHNVQYSTMVTRARLNVTLYIHCLPALLFLHSCSQKWWLARFPHQFCTVSCSNNVHITSKFQPVWNRHFIKCTVVYCRMPSRANSATFPLLIFVNKVKYRLKSSGTLRSSETSVNVYQPKQRNIPHGSNPKPLKI